MISPQTSVPCPQCGTPIPFSAQRLISGESFHCPNCHAVLNLAGNSLNNLKGNKFENHSERAAPAPQPSKPPVEEKEPTELEMLIQDERLLAEEIEYIKKHLKKLEQILANTRRRIEIEKKK